MMKVKLLRINNVAAATDPNASFIQVKPFPLKMKVGEIKDLEDQKAGLLISKYPKIFELIKAETKKEEPKEEPKKYPFKKK